MKLELKIAGRYLFARKSHNVINVISGISAAGMAIGTAALVIILSVYNGFNKIIDDNLSDFDPDLRIVAADRGVFSADTLPAAISLIPGITLQEVLEFDAFVSYEGRQSVVRIKGSDGSGLYSGELPQAFVGAGIAAKLGMNPAFTSPAVLYYADRNRKISMLHPESALRSEKVFPAHIFSVNPEIDDRMIIVPIDVARRLYDSDGVSSVEICAEPDSGTSLETCKSLVPAGFEALDRHRQHPEMYRMMKLEKFAVFSILVLVVLLVALNIYGSLSMLIMEKRQDIVSLRAMGATDSMVRRIFVLEGWSISALGMAVGLTFGVVVVLLQARFGIVAMPGNFLVTSYPVALQVTDVILCAAAVLATGLVIALGSVSFAGNSYFVPKILSPASPRPGTM